jgi:hypothetical protein
MSWVLRMRAKRNTPSTAPAASVPVTRVTLTALLLDVDCSANFGTRRLVAARIGSLKSSVIWPAFRSRAKANRRGCVESGV